MSAATGLGPLEVAVLESFDACGAQPGEPPAKNEHVLEALHLRHGFSASQGFQVVCELGRAWNVNLILVDFHGNAGSPDFSAASPRYTEGRLTPLGALALAAEHGVIGALPIGLINGDTYVDGRRPPFEPERLCAALAGAHAGATDQEVIALVGSAHFPTGCHVEYDHDAFAAGVRVVATLSANIAVLDRQRLLIDALPPGVSCGEVVMSVLGATERPAWESDALRVTDVNDETTGDQTRIIVRLADGADVDAALVALRQIWGIRVELPIGLGAPLAELLRSWLALHGSVDLDARLDRVRAASEWQAHRSQR